MLCIPLQKKFYARHLRCNLWIEGGLHLFYAWHLRLRKKEMDVLIDLVGFYNIFSLCFVPDEKELYIGNFCAILFWCWFVLQELDFVMLVSTRAYITVWILSNDMMQQNNLTGKVGITLSLIDFMYQSKPFSAFVFGHTHDRKSRIQNK